MNIEINQNLISTLERLANERSVSTTDYVSGIIEKHLLSQYKTNLIETISNQKVEDIPTFESAIMTVDADIKVRDYIEPTIEKEVQFIEDVVASTIIVK